MNRAIEGFTKVNNKYKKLNRLARKNFDSII